MLLHDPVDPFVVHGILALLDQHPDQEAMDPAITVAGTLIDQRADLGKKARSSSFL